MTRDIMQTCLIASAVLISAPAVSGSLENLERERSIIVSHLLDADLEIVAVGRDSPLRALRNRREIGEES